MGICFSCVYFDAILILDHGKGLHKSLVHTTVTYMKIRIPASNNELIFFIAIVRTNHACCMATLQKLQSMHTISYRLSETNDDADIITNKPILSDSDM